MKCNQSGPGTRVAVSISCDANHYTTGTSTVWVRRWERERERERDRERQEGETTRNTCFGECQYGSVCVIRNGNENELIIIKAVILIILIILISRNICLYECNNKKKDFKELPIPFSSLSLSLSLSLCIYIYIHTYWSEKNYQEQWIEIDSQETLWWSLSLSLSPSLCIYIHIYTHIDPRRTTKSNG